MSGKLWPLLIAGVLPAFLYGVSALFQKFSTNTGISLMPYLIAVGVGVALAGVLIGLFSIQGGWQAVNYSLKGFLYANLFGLLWGLASGLVAFGLIHYRVPISQLVPLYNMNTLVAVLLALLVFSEWRDLQAIKLIGGAVLVVLGGILVATA